VSGASDLIITSFCGVPFQNKKAVVSSMFHPLAKIKYLAGVVPHIFNPSTWEDETAKCQAYHKCASPKNSSI
jgi:hypothetical protein